MFYDTSLPDEPMAAYDFPPPDDPAPATCDAYPGTCECKDCQERERDAAIYEASIANHSNE